jgi:hypothetical protein
MSLVERLIPPPSLADRREALHRAGGWLSEMGGGGGECYRWAMQCLAGQEHSSILTTRTDAAPLTCGQDESTAQGRWIVCMNALLNFNT